MKHLHTALEYELVKLDMQTAARDLVEHGRLKAAKLQKAA